MHSQAHGRAADTAMEGLWKDVDVLMYRFIDVTLAVRASSAWYDSTQFHPLMDRMLKHSIARTSAADNIR